MVKTGSLDDDEGSTGGSVQVRTGHNSYSTLACAFVGFNTFLGTLFRPQSGTDSDAAGSWSSATHSEADYTDSEWPGNYSSIAVFFPNAFSHVLLYRSLRRSEPPWHWAQRCIIPMDTTVRCDSVPPQTCPRSLTGRRVTACLGDPCIAHAVCCADGQSSSCAARSRNRWQLH